MKSTCKILEYRHINNGIAYRVYDLYGNPDAYIDYGMFHTMNDVIEYCEKNDIRDYFDMTYRFVW